MHISSLIQPEFIKLQLEATTRADAIRESAGLLSTHPHMKNFDLFYDELLARERVEPTCLGNDICFPHARTDAVDDMTLSVGCAPEGILFDNCGQTVRLIFVIGTPKRMVTEYLKLVGGLARLLKESEMRNDLLSAKDPEAFISSIDSAEAKA